MKDNFENIFSEAFVSYRPETHDEVWQKLAPALRRQNFLKFGTAHFNIYYTILLAAVAGFGIYVGIARHNPAIKPENEKVIKKEIVPVFNNEIKKTENQDNYNAKLRSCINKKDSLKAVNYKPSNIDETKADTAFNKFRNDSIKISNQNNGSLPNANPVTVFKTEKKKIKKVTVIVKNPVVISDSLVEYKK
jgi:hypothetical protein